MSSIVLLSNDSEGVRHLCKNDKRLAKVISLVGNYTYRPYDDSFSFLTNQIIGQMLSSKVSDKISERLKELCNGTVSIDKILRLNESEMRLTGMSLTKAKFIHNLALAVKNQEIDFNIIAGKNDEEVIRELSKLKGIGTWTAKMYLIFVLDRKDILPYEDKAFLQSYSWLYKTDDLSKTSIEKRCKKWKPYSSIAARYLYKALDSGLTKTEFHLFKDC